MSESKNEEIPEEVEFTEEELETIADFKNAMDGIDGQLKSLFDGFEDLDIHKYDYDSLNKMYDSAMNRARQAQPGHVLFYNKKK